MKKVIVMLSLLFLLPTVALAADKIINCEIHSNGMPTFKNKCTFSPSPGGSFYLTSAPGKPFLDGISSVSVDIVGKGVAEVRGLTADGINSRWGEAKRSSKDKACWIGSDFKICAR
jgi:hypothetical protein